MFRAEHCGADRYQAFRIWEAAASEIADAIRFGRFAVNRRYVAVNGIDIRLFLDHVDDEMPESVSRERETLRIHTSMSAVVVRPHEERGAIEVQTSNGGSRHSNAWRVG